MKVTDSQKQQVIRLLQAKTSERAISEQTELSRRQIRNIKQQAQKNDDHPLAMDQQTMTRATAVAELVKLSTRPGGVRRSEMWPVLRDLFGVTFNNKTGAWELDMTENQLRYLREKTTKSAADQGKTALFPPEWLPRKAPVAANDMLVTLAGYLHDRAREYVADFTHSFPGSSQPQVFNELVYIAFNQASPVPVPTRCQRNAHAAELLQGRLGHLTQRPAANDAPAFEPDSELDRLCI